MRFPNQTHMLSVSVGGDWSFRECRSEEMAGTIRPPSHNRRSCTGYCRWEFSIPAIRVCQQLQTSLQLAKRSSEVALRVCVSSSAFRQKLLAPGICGRLDHSGRVPPSSCESARMGFSGTTLPAQPPSRKGDNCHSVESPLTGYLQNRFLSFPKIPSVLDSHHKAESSQH